MKPMIRTSASVQFLPLGTIASSTPRLQILAALQRLCPQFELRLQKLAEHRYELHIRAEDLSAQRTSDTAWLRIKGVLASEFPEHKPGFVQIIES